MKDLIQKHIDNNFSDFKGLSITATIPLKDQLINEAISEALQSLSSPPSSSASGFDARNLVQFVKKAEVRAVEGTIVLDVVINI